MGLYLGGLIIGRIFASEIWGPCFREGLFFLFSFLFFFAGGGGGGRELIIGILRYSVTLIVKFVVRVHEVIANDYRNVTVKSP